MSGIQRECPGNCLDIEVRVYILVLEFRWVDRQEQGARKLDTRAQLAFEVPLRKKLTKWRTTFAKESLNQCSRRRT